MCGDRDLTRYDLASRGVRVISGRNEDDEGAASNGAGKSALVMAPLWALTGRSDARTEVPILATCAATAWLRAVLCRPACLLPCPHAGYPVPVVAGWSAQQCRRSCTSCFRQHAEDSRGVQPMSLIQLLHISGPWCAAQGGGSRGLTSADVVNDDCKSARVRVEGSVNGKAFVVERITRRRERLPVNMLLWTDRGTGCPLSRPLG